MAQRGRPTKYTRKIADTICARLATGKYLRVICRTDDNLPAEATVRAWAAKDIDGFYARFARARDIGMDCMAEENLDLSDTPIQTERVRWTGIGTAEVTVGDNIERARLMIDTRKWYLAKMAPKRYGDRSKDLETDPNQPDDRLKELTEAIRGSQAVMDSLPGGEVSIVTDSSDDGDGPSQ